MLTISHSKDWHEGVIGDDDVIWNEDSENGGECILFLHITLSAQRWFMYLCLCGVCACYLLSYFASEVDRKRGP